MYQHNEQQQTPLLQAHLTEFANSLTEKLGDMASISTAISPSKKRRTIDEIE